jgi:hypothetical protein
MKILIKNMGAKLRGISEVAVDRRATVQQIPALGDRGLSKKLKQARNDQN